MGFAFAPGFRDSADSDCCDGELESAGVGDSIAGFAVNRIGSLRRPSIGEPSTVRSTWPIPTWTGSATIVRAVAGESTGAEGTSPAIRSGAVPGDGERRRSVSLLPRERTDGFIG